MRVSLNWLKKFVKIDVSDEELVRLIGARLVEVEDVIDETHKYDNIFVVRVESCEKIPDTHLTLCQINCGKPELVQVVCGAPNVHEGMLAVWIAPGAIVPASVHEDAPFVIGKRKMLGKYESYGMLAGADELDFDDKHEKIAEIDPAMAKPGDSLADVFELSDLILDIENKSLTHRPDTFGMIGFAREVAGILGTTFSEPNLSSSGLGSSGIENINISIADPDICSRYSAVVMEKHGELKQKYLTFQDTILSKSGMRPVDPIVDATNYMMLLTGQPLHAFDYDKFVAVGGGKTPEIVVRLAKNSEKITLIDGKEIELNSNDIVICSGKVPVALAGAMGGESTEIDENTRNIIIESATFSLYNLRKTQMSHGIFTEAITRFTKGQPAYQTLTVARECAGLLGDGFREVEEADNYPNPAKKIVVKITTDEVNGLLGTEYTEKEMISTLENVGFVVQNNDGVLTIDVPDWRTDIHIKEDIIEEIGRLNGYDNIEPVLPLHGTAEKNSMFALKTEVRNIMERFGANELLTYSFVSGKLLEKAGLDVTNSYRIVNSISPELQYIRQSIVPSLLDKAYMNQKFPVDKFAIYEMNKVYQKSWGMDDENVPVEKMRMGFVVAERKGSGTAFYKAKYYMEQLLKQFNIAVKILPIVEQAAETLPYEPKRAGEVWVGETKIGVVGEFRNVVKHNFKLEDYLAGFELDFDAVLGLSQPTREVMNFEIKTKQDITVTTDENYAEAFAKIQAENPEAKISPVGIYQPEGVKEKNITFHLEF